MPMPMSHSLSNTPFVGLYRSSLFHPLHTCTPQALNMIYSKASLKTLVRTLSSTGRRRLSSLRCSAEANSATYSITVLPGDGIGPEVISVAKDVLSLAASQEGFKLKFKEMPMGGSALDLVGVPLPEETLAAAKSGDAVLLGAIGGYKWDNNEKHLKPETGLLGLRAGLGVFANLRPAVVLPQVLDDCDANLF